MCVCVWKKGGHNRPLLFSGGVFYPRRAKNEMNETARVMGDLKLMEDAPKRCDWLNVRSL